MYTISCSLCDTSHEHNIDSDRLEWFEGYYMRMPVYGLERGAENIIKGKLVNKSLVNYILSAS